MPNKNKHIRAIEKKIRRFDKTGKNTEGLKKELSCAKGDSKPKEFRTGHTARSIGEAKRSRAVVRSDKDSSNG